MSQNPLVFQQLLERHAQHENEPMSLSKSFLDGAFLNLSPIARQVRREVLNSNIKLTELRDGLEKDFAYQNHIFILPLQHQKKELYYKNNVDTFLFLIEKFPNLKQVDARIIMPLHNSNVENKLLHESIHLLTFEQVFKTVSYHYKPDFSEEETHEWMLRHLTIEGSVLALELMSTVVHPSFENTYITHFSCHQSAEYPKEYHTLLSASREFGLLRLYRLLARGFLVANLSPHNTALNEPMARLVCEDLFDNPLAIKACSRSQELGKAFRIGSNWRYFSSLGYPHIFEQAIQQWSLESHFDFSIVDQIIQQNGARFLSAT